MPIYEYRCSDCQADWDVVKSMSQLERKETCPACGRENGCKSRLPPRGTSFSGASDWNTQHFSPALGRVVKNHRHARQVAKEKGMIEVGNESPDKIHKHFDDQRQETRKKRWESA